MVTRRQYLSRALAWLTQGPFPPGMDETVPGRIPLPSLNELPEHVLMGLVPVLRHGGVPRSVTTVYRIWTPATRKAWFTLTRRVALLFSCLMVPGHLPRQQRHWSKKWTWRMAGVPLSFDTFSLSWLARRSFTPADRWPRYRRKMKTGMNSVLVVTSWWSNCLGLVCLARLKAFAQGREIFVMQAGKSESQMERFRRFLPVGVTELLYPSHNAPDDSAMREYLSKEALADKEGVWFFDHDTFLLSSSESFFQWSDSIFANSHVCICTRKPVPGQGVTQPAYWLSPMRWPNDLSPFTACSLPTKALCPEAGPVLS